MRGRGNREPGREGQTHRAAERQSTREEAEDGDEELTLDSGNTWISVFIVRMQHDVETSRSEFVCRDESGMWGKTSSDSAKS